MRLLSLAIVLMLALSGCAELDIREDKAEVQSGPGAAPNDLPSHEDLYRLAAQEPAPATQAPRGDPAPDYGLWTRLARDFTMYSMVHDRIDREMFGYLSRLDQLQTITQRAEPYLFFIVEQLRERGMPMELALLPIVESAYQPQATSRSQAAGLWQFIPSTGQHFGLKQNWWYDGRRDVHASTQAALDYLQRLNDMFEGDWTLALAAYNAGEGTVSRAIERAASKGEPTDYWSLDLPEETKAYVPRLIALSRLFHDPHVYGLIPHKVEDAPFLARIELDRPLDLSKVANAMDMSVDELYRLNPGFKRGVNGNGKETVALLLPQDKAHRLKTMDMKELYAVLPRQRQIKAARDESAASFARRFGVSLATLRDMNPLLRDKVTRGQTVLLPERPSERIELAEAKPATSAAPGKAINHAVSPGENLYQISRQHGVDTQTLASWNGLKPDTTLKAGQKLVIYTDPSWTRGPHPEGASGMEAGRVGGEGSADRGSPKALREAGEARPKGSAQGADGLREAKIAEGRPTSTPSATAKAPAGEARKTTYTVQKGDTLFSIARRFKVEVAQLRQWNKLDEKGELKPGQTIVVVLAEAPSKAS
ncbi:MAG: LysM peptidoglycan-binding domain-containing protein [Pseudomonadota bacterium]|jgi:membrane-bound lytic murein transglycosylase D